MKLRGAVAVVLLAIPVVAVAPAQAASTRAEYIAQVDPMCQSFVGPQSNALSSFINNTKRLGRVARAAVKSGKFQAFLRQMRRTAGALSGYAQIHASLTDQIVAVPPPAGDAGTVGTWVNARRQAEGVARSAALALSQFKFKVFLKRLDQSDAAESAGLNAISGMGFQVCGVSV
jgi:hypothetical protein